MGGHDLFEIIAQHVPCDGFKPDKVPEELIHRCWRPALRRQRRKHASWRFIVIEDPAVKQNVGRTTDAPGMIRRRRATAPAAGAGCRSRAVSADARGG